MRDNSQHTSFTDILIGFLGLALAFPVFILAHRQLPDMGWPWHADRIILFITIVLFLILLLRIFKPIIAIGFIAALFWLGYGTATGNYGYKDVYHDYRALLFSINNDPSRQPIVFSFTGKAARQKQILDAIDYQKPTVRNFAVAATNQYFKTEQQKNEDYRTLIQSFAVFKKINENWNYVYDPVSREYFATGSESVSLLAGDCDDYSILMAAAIKSIGGRIRLVITTGHIYPELFIGNKNDLERINFIIKKQLFSSESRGQDIFYHKDEDGSIWLNLDYTAKYPGGVFLSEAVHEIIYP